MPDAPEPRYRYWGSHKPIAFAVTDPAAPKTGTTASMRIYGPIDSWGAPFGVSADEFSQALAALGDDVETIDLHMHSVGGEVFEGLAIMNQLRQHKATVNLVVDGLAASIASVIAMGANTVAMAPGAQMMVHDASGICIGTAGDMATMNSRLESLSSNIAEVYAARAGGTAEDWRAAMQPESWYKAQEAVDAGLADRVLTKDEAPTQPKAEFDLSMFAHAGRDHAPAPVMPARASHTPAEPPVVPSTEHEEADAMSDTLNKGLRERLGVADDADEATILAALDEALAEQTAPPAAPPAPAPTALPEGQVAVNASVLEELRIAARAGQEARAVQLRQDRDETINAAIIGGHVSPARREHWTQQWDADPEGIRAALAELTQGEPLFPIGDAPGHGGDLDTEARYTDAMAAEDAELFGLPKEAFAR